MPWAPSRRRLLTALAGLPLLAPGAAPAALFPEAGLWRFDALGPEAAPLGALEYRFRRSPGVFTVTVAANWRLPAPGGAVSERHRAEERWRDGWLYGLDSSTRRGAARHRVRIARDDEALRGERDGHPFSLSGYVVPASLWHPETPRLPALLDSVTGRMRIVRGRRGPREPVPLGGGRVEATYWRLSGELERELWYDAGRRLVRARFAAPDGSPVVLQRRA